MFMSAVSIWCSICLYIFSYSPADYTLVMYGIISVLHYAVACNEQKKILAKYGNYSNPSPLDLRALCRVGFYMFLHVAFLGKSLFALRA